MSDILYNVDPRMINTELACIVGLNEASVLLHRSIGALSKLGMKGQALAHIVR